MRGQEGFEAAKVAFGEGFGHPATQNSIGLTVEGGRRRDDIASLGEQIDPLPFQAEDVQMRR